MTNTVDWDQAEKLAEEYGGGQYIRLKDDGDKFVGLIRGDPLPHETYFDDHKKAYEPFTADHRARGLRPTMRFILNVCEITKKQDGSYSLEDKAVEFNVVTFKTMSAVRKKYGADKAVEVTRHGKQNDTKTTYSVLPEDVPQNVIEAAKARPLLDLRSLSGGEDNSAPAPQQAYQPGQVAPKTPVAPGQIQGQVAGYGGQVAPVQGQGQVQGQVAGQVQGLDKDAQNAIKAAIQSVPNWKDVAKEYFGFFGVGHVRDIPAFRRDEALAKCEEIVGKYTPQEVDPFAS